MKTFKPPIEERDNDDLIEIANSDIKVWEKEAIEQAQIELKKRNISQEFQNEVLAKWNDEAEKFIKEEIAKLEANKIESYTKLECLLLFVFAPFIFINRGVFGIKSLLVLKSENYLFMLKQRLIIYLLSFSTYAACIAYYAYWKEQKWQEEIEKIDISEWKEKNGIK